MTYLYSQDVSSIKTAQALEKSRKDMLRIAQFIRKDAEQDQKER